MWFGVFFWSVVEILRLEGRESFIFLKVCIWLVGVGGGVLRRWLTSE